MYKAVIVLLILVIFLHILMAELDRTYGYKAQMKHYYSHYYGFGLIGVLNSYIRFIRLFHKDRIYSHVFPVSIFPQHQILVDNFEQIKAEILNAYSRIQIPAFHQIDSVFSRISDEKWKTLVIKWYDKNINTSICPFTSDLINQMPNVKLAMFSILEAGKYIPMHRGPSKLCLRYHLGIEIPQGECYIKINGEKFYWKEKQALIFDDTFRHEVYNNTGSKRIILFIDFVRPLPSPFYQLANKLCDSSSISSKINQLNKRAEIQQDI